MECRKVEQVIDAYLDHELPAVRAREVESHLATCDTCRKEYGPLLSLLRSPEPVATPTDLRSRVLAAVNATTLNESQPKKHHQRIRWAPWSGAIAASLSFFFMGWLASQWWQKPAPPEPSTGTRETVVMSPFMASSIVQAMTLRGPANPIPCIAQAFAIELASAPQAGTVETVRSPQRAVSRPAVPTENNVPPAEFLLLPTLYKPLGV